MEQIKGIAASPGVAIGKAFFLDKEDFTIKKHPIKKTDIESEMQRLDFAIEKSRKEIDGISKKIGSSLGNKNARIFEAQIMVLNDPMFIDRIRAQIKMKLANTEYAVWTTMEELSNLFIKSKDQLLRERAVDLHDIGRRILRNLLGMERKVLATLEEEVIVVAADLAPSDTAQMRKEKVIAFVTDMGGRTSHTAIMARSLEIPAIVGLEKITEKAEQGDLLIVDGNSGTVIIRPTKEIIKKYEYERKLFVAREKDLGKLITLPAQTLDGKNIRLMANIEVPEEVQVAVRYGAQGIGLYRTEFLYLSRTDLPNEEEQFRAYKHVAKIMDPKPVTIRTLDLGGDKFLSHLNLPQEINPSLGCRGIRLCLEMPEIFKVQLRAILRASVYGNLKIMYPLISGIEELRMANEMLESAKKKLISQKIPFNKDLQVGVMIEVPSAALIADLLVKEARFFSIGTNDLIQYSLAIDRVNEKIAYLYEPLHPGILRLVKSIIVTAKKAGIEVSMCGEMAGDPLFVPVLLGMGLDIFSMGPISIPNIKEIIRQTDTKKSKELAARVMNFSSARDIEEFLKM